MGQDLRQAYREHFLGPVKLGVNPELPEKLLQIDGLCVICLVESLTYRWIISLT